ncbi:hypothetical protein LCGC14_1860550 [marine sediment metagenome]|uniref:Uncharacterized protein n=1 Tax=marine sediment metagenome TaxID=412755 RepID=A0A0F9IM54_9ZZZZ
MNKKDWQDKLKEFLEMEKKSKENLIVVQKQLEEIDLFSEAVKSKIKTFK